MKRYQIIILAAVALGDIAFVLWHYRLLSPRNAHPRQAPAVSFRIEPTPVQTAVSTPDTSAPSPTPEAAALTGSGDSLAEELNAPDGDGQQDVEALHMIVRRYFRMLRQRQGPPIGDDIDLTKVLRGHNPMHYIFLPDGHPAVTQDGHLRDRWGTPYFIHPLGYGNFEIRSAGPDRRLFTDDDAVYGAAQKQTEVPDHFSAAPETSPDASP